MLDLASAFAPDYAGAREKFHAAAAARSLAVERHLHPSARGVTGEELAIDVVMAGNADAAAVLFVSSAMHGVEGFCGSGCQVGLLRDDVVQAALGLCGVALVLVHAVNPYGFSHLRRTNEDNVDLNRNFRDFRAPPPSNDPRATLKGGYKDAAHVARNMELVATMPKAPGLFSTTSDWPRIGRMLSATMRATMSVAPPGA